MTFVLVAVLLSTLMSSYVSHLKLGNSIYFAAIFQYIVFILLRYFILNGGKNNANAQIRRIMIASTTRMLIILMFLVITMLNQPKVNIPWTIAYGVYFLLFLVFDISEKHTNLRPDLKSSDENGNA